MSHLLLAEKHQAILFKNTESRPAREIHAMIVVGPSKGVSAVHLSEAPRRSPRGFQRRPPPQNFKFRSKDQKPMYVPPKYKPQSKSHPHVINVAAQAIMLCH